MKHCDKIHLKQFILTILISPIVILVVSGVYMVVAIMQPFYFIYLGMKGEPTGKYKVTDIMIDKKLRYKEPK